MKKLCYILPDYDEENISHFYHLYEFLEKLSEKMDLFIIAEKFTPSNDPGSKGKEIKLGSRFYSQKFRFLPLRFLESFFIILRARILGYKNFYTHYCYIGAINAGIISRLCRGQSYYWNCAMNWLFRQRTFSKIGLNLSLKLSHYLVTGGEMMKKGYADYYNLKPEKIKLLNQRINLKRFNKRRYTRIKPPDVHRGDTQKHADVQRGSARPKVILFVHWLSKRKGADTIVPIILSLKTHVNNFKFLVIGDGPYKDRLLDEIRENKLEKIIEVLGAVPNKDIVRYYDMADILILPSMEEGFPMTLLESMAMGMPYVASDIGAVREISPPTAQRFLVKPSDIEKFAHKLEILLTDKKIYNRFRREELEKVKEYSLDKVIDKFITLFS